MKYCFLFLLASAAHAAPLHVYAHLGVAADLQPQQYATWQWSCAPESCGYRHEERRLFVPGAMDDVSIGVGKGPLFLELHHLSAIPDGFAGRGITWLSTGLNFDLWESKPWR